jgi:chemotaxis protein methyltransferase CheR
MSLNSVELSSKQFEKVSRLVYRFSGINLKEGKEALVRARLMKRVRALRMQSIDAYMKYLQSQEGVGELGDMIDAMTTNKTGFFREAEHFNFMREKLLPEITNSKMRFWTAACSSGEEPFSLAITLRESLADIDSRDCLILATDISRRMLEAAWRAVYSQEAIRELPPPIIRKYFRKITNGANPSFQVTDPVRALVRFAWLNLMNPWPMSGPFNVIFCRNAMIYFDRGTQQKLITRFWDLLAPGGYLFVGHSEGLSGVSHKFGYVQPAIYRK